MAKCVECNKEFNKKRKEQKFCSHACSVKHNRRFNTVWR